MKKRFVLMFIGSMFILFILGCTSVQDNDVNESEIKGQIYHQALLELNEANATSNDLNLRFNALDNKINKIVAGDEELSIAQFTRIKIELDYLRTKNYSKEKINIIWNKFIKVSQMETVKKVDDRGYSLNDRYYTLSRKIDKLNQSKTELKVSEYFSLENELDSLESDGYIVSRISELRSKLIKLVIAELENAIIYFEVPEMVEEREIVKVSPTEPAPAQIVKGEKMELPTGPSTYVVLLVNGGFDTKTLRIKVNDTVKWRNVREGRYRIAMVLGNRNCRDIKSGLFNEGDSYNWTFLENGTCWISDGIYTTQAMQIIID